MIFVAVHYWPYLLAALVAGVCVGWWGQASTARRARAPLAEDPGSDAAATPRAEGWE